MSSLPRRSAKFLLRWTRRGVLLNASVCAAFVFIASTAKDDRLRKAIHAAPALSIPRAHPWTATIAEYASKWAKGSRRVATAAVMTTDELAMMQSVVSLLSFDLRPEVFDSFLTTAEVTDTLVCVRGLSELKDAWTFLALFFVETKPVIQAVYRGASGELIAEIETQATPILLSLAKPVVFRSVIVCRTAPNVLGGSRIRTLEHHWFGGPIVGSMSYNPWPFAWLGDSARRWNGLVLSLLTNWRSADFPTVNRLASPVGPTSSSSGT